jgi:hypothetical protein
MLGWAVADRERPALLLVPFVTRSVRPQSRAVLVAINKDSVPPDVR